MAQITFGKWQGWDTNRLAQAGSFGRDYLSWGAQNLESLKWKKEFDRALNNNREMSRDAMASAITQHYADLGPEMDQVIEAELKEWNHVNGCEDTQRKLTNYFERKLKELQVSENGIAYLKTNHWQIEELLERGKVQFANGNEEVIIDLCGRYSEKMYEVEFA